MTYQSAPGSGMSEWLLGTVRQNPEGLLLLAAGAVLLMRKTSSSPSNRAATTHFQQSSSPTEFSTEADDSRGGGFARQVKDTASSFASSASEYAGEARRTVGAKSQRIATSAQSTLKNSMNRVLQEQPLLVAAAGLAAGAAVAAAFPATEMEKQTLGPLGDQLSGAAARAGEQLQEATVKAGEKLKSSVEERGLNATGLKEVVADAASTFSDTLSGKKAQGSESGSPPLNQSGFNQKSLKQRIGAMSDKTLRQFEGDVEMARMRLTDSLATLRSPETISAFTEDLKKEALNTKDALVDQVKTAAQSKVTGLLEGLKAKAAANPAAALAVGAGLAWHFIRNPPIASALVGLGILSLWRTDASYPPGSYRPDYLAVGKQRLKEQASDALLKVKDIAIEGQDAMSAKTADLADAAKDRAQRWTADIREAVEEAGASLKADAPSIAPSAAEDSGTFTKVTERAGEVFDSAAAATRSALHNPESRDKVLLGVAGLAVAAALGIACQKRLADVQGQFAD